MGIHGDVRLTLVIMSSIMLVALEGRNFGIGWIEKVHCELHSSNSSMASKHIETLMAHKKNPREGEHRGKNYLSNQNEGDGVTSARRGSMQRTQCCLQDINAHICRKQGCLA